VELKLLCQNQCFRIKTTFNRTIVELKLFRHAILKPRIYSFNRTIVELKQDGNGHISAAGETFNRTIVELKPSMGKD